MNLNFFTPITLLKVQNHEVTDAGDAIIHLHLLAFEGEQGLLSIVQSLQLRSRRRVVKHLRSYRQSKTFAYQFYKLYPMTCGT